MLSEVCRRWTRLSGTILLSLCGVNSARAELTSITPELIQKVWSMADSAKRAHPTSPNDAGASFIAEFNGEFGDITPVDLHIVSTPQLAIVMTTPLSQLRAFLVSALARLEPLPEPKTLLIRSVRIDIQPSQRTARNVTRVVVFRGNDELQPIRNTLAPRAFTTGVGAQVMLNAGAVEFGEEALQPGPPLRIVCLNDGPPIEWSLSSADIARVR